MTALMLSVILVLVLPVTALSPARADVSIVGSVPHKFSIKNIIEEEAKIHGINPDLAVKIAMCESSLRPWAYNHDGGAEARGLWQITRKYHPEVSDEVAFDGSSSTRWAMEMMRRGRFWEWSCYELVKNSS